MNLEDVEISRNVTIGGKYWGTALCGVTATATDVRPAPASPDDNPAYPCGMVEVLLPDGVDWPTSVVWIGPEDLSSAVAR